MAEEKRLMSAADRISNLPDNVIEHLLSYLPYGEAVATSILSRNWRHKWMSIPRLTFDSKFYSSLNKKNDIEAIVYRALIFNKGPVLEFNLEHHYAVRQLAIDTWLQFLSYKQIQHLLLDVPKYLDPYVMPHHLFTFDHLTYLCLTRVLIRTPPAFKGFPRLVSLDLQSIVIEHEDLSGFLSKFRTIESLQLWYCETLGNLYVKAPKLKCFKYVGNFCSIFVDASRVEKLSIEYACVENAGNGTVEQIWADANLIATFGYLPSNITKLEIHYPVLKHLTMFGIPENPFEFNNLAGIKLFDAQFEETDFIRFALCLIKSSPNLTRLKITVASSTFCHTLAQDPAALQYLKAQQESEARLPCLKNVEIHRMSGTEIEMEFVRLILLWATALEKLVFVDSSCNDPSSKAEGLMLRQLLGFRRASTSAEVICNPKA